MPKKDEINEFINGIIQTEYLENIMGERFGSYAKYIIQDRAIPDVRDGLKPVQRRILYAMKAAGMIYAQPYKKSARIVGEVIGKYHPHGDTSVYDALVRMSQDFKINVPLIDMHGNNGSIDGDGAAAMRYTEARLSLASMYLLEDIEKKTVQFQPNYDDSEIEPVVLPAKFPNLLVNGSEGISAGYATNIPPHNINEVINLTIEKIKNPKLTLEEAMAIMPGPDFPTGGTILEAELKDAYSTGRGKIIIRSKSEIVGNDIIITEIPYGVVKSALVKRIDTVCNTKQVSGVEEVRDESDKDGLRIVIECKKEANPEVILNYLYKSTDLQINFNYNMVAIVDRGPKTLGVLDIIDAYIEHAKEVIRNRSYFELDKAKKRLHIVEGLAKLTKISDEVISTIRKSNGKQDSKNNIMAEFDFTELQAEAIVTLQLYRLSKFEVEELLREMNELNENIKVLDNILNNENALKKVVIKELEDVNSKIVLNRKSIITKEASEITYKEEDLIIHENVRVVISKDGYIKRLSLKAYQAATKDGSYNPGVKENDFIIYDNVLNTKDTIMLFTSLGSYINLPVYKIPEIKLKDMGEYIGSLFDVSGNEKIVEIIVIDKPVEPGTKILLSTKFGKVKLSDTAELFDRKYKKGTCMKMAEDDDELVSASLEGADTEEVLVTTKLGYVIKYPKNEVTVSGLKAVGVKSINLRNKDEVISSYLVPNYYKEELLLLLNRGSLKRVFLKNIDRSKRAGKTTPLLKSVKSNPYMVVSALITNPSRYKDSIELDILTDDGMIEYKGTEIPKDTFENGCPLDTKSKPISLYLTISDKDEYDKANKELSKDLKKSIDEIKEAHPNSLIDELGDIIEKQGSIFDFLDDSSDESDNDNKENNDDDFDLEKLKEDLF